MWATHQKTRRERHQRSATRQEPERWPGATMTTVAQIGQRLGDTQKIAVDQERNPLQDAASVALQSLDPIHAGRGTNQYHHTPRHNDRPAVNGAGSIGGFPACTQPRTHGRNRARRNSSYLNDTVCSRYPQNLRPNTPGSNQYIATTGSAPASTAALSAMNL